MFPRCVCVMLLATLMILSLATCAIGCCWDLAAGHRYSVTTDAWTWLGGQDVNVDDPTPHIKNGEYPPYVSPFKMIGVTSRFNTNILPGITTMNFTFKNIEVDSDIGDFFVSEETPMANISSCENFTQRFETLFVKDSNRSFHLRGFVWPNGTRVMECKSKPGLVSAMQFDGYYLDWDASYQPENRARNLLADVHRYLHPFNRKPWPLKRSSSDQRNASSGICFTAAGGMTFLRNTTIAGSTLSVFSADWSDDMFEDLGPNSMQWAVNVEGDCAPVSVRFQWDMFHVRSYPRNREDVDPLVGLPAMYTFSDYSDKIPQPAFEVPEECFRGGLPI